jgi:hypothetical protein
MQDNKQLLGGTLITGMALALVLAACATAGGGGAPAAPDKAAAQLAAKFNALEAGSAKAEGGTVRLSGDLRLKTGLTVPAGVTLDLTADKAKFELQNGAKLTVDGAVNATGHGDQGKGWVEGGLRIGDGASVINGSGTISLKSRGCLLNVWEKCRLTLDGVTLVGIADNDSPLVQVGGELLMKSGKITGNTTTNGGGGVQVHKGTFIMEGGEIWGNTSASNVNGGGGALYGGEDCVFIMKGGIIYGNRSARLAGGVMLGGSSERNNGTFIMEGGRIQGGTASDGFAANTDRRDAATLLTAGSPVSSTATWGTGGTYTKGGGAPGGAAQTGGSDIATTDDTLITKPAQ